MSQSQITVRMSLFLTFSSTICWAPLSQGPVTSATLSLGNEWKEEMLPDAKVGLRH